MPTINQLVRNGRKNLVEKSKAPALGKRWDSLNKKEQQSSRPTKTWRLHPCWYHDPKEAKLSFA